MKVLLCSSSCLKSGKDVMPLQSFGFMTGFGSINILTMRYSLRLRNISRHSCFQCMMCTPHFSMSLTSLMQGIKHLLIAPLSLALPSLAVLMILPLLIWGPGGIHGISQLLSFPTNVGPNGKYLVILLALESALDILGSGREREDSTW